MHSLTIKTLLSAAMLTGLPTGAAFGQDTFAFTLNQPQSTINAAFRTEADFFGTFVGNYNAKTNPTGTRTLLGTFGVCTAGNQDIGYTGSGSAAGNPTTNPTGDFLLRIDTETETATLYNLRIDMLGGATPTVQSESTMNYQAFRTCNPTGFFPSIPVSLSLGEVVITRLAATQVCASSVGTIKNLNPGTYTFNVPTTVLVDSGVSFAGGEQKTAPVEIPVIVAGNVTIGDVMAVADVTLTLELDQAVEGPFVVAEDRVFDLDNPLGGTVHLLIDVTLDSITLDLTAGASIRANGIVTATPCPADWNRDGSLNSQDFFDFLSAFFQGSADFNCSSDTNSQDFFDFLSGFFAGC